MIELFTETRGRTRLLWSIILFALNLALLFLGGVIWFWLWAIAGVLLFSCVVGEF